MKIVLPRFLQLQQLQSVLRLSVYIKEMRIFAYNFFASAGKGACFELKPYFLVVWPKQHEYCCWCARVKEVFNGSFDKKCCSSGPHEKWLGLDVFKQMN